MGCRIKAKELSLSYNLPIVRGKKKIWIHAFLKALARIETQKPRPGFDLGSPNLLPVTIAVTQSPFPSDISMMQLENS